jgi:hypothetical protein
MVFMVSVRSTQPPRAMLRITAAIMPNVKSLLVIAKSLNSLRVYYKQKQPV